MTSLVVVGLHDFGSRGLHGVASARGIQKLPPIK